MPHSIFGERAVSYKVPMWHSLGIVADEPMGAEEAFERSGAYEVTLEPLRLRRKEFSVPADPSDEDQTPEVVKAPAIDQMAIVRHPTLDSPQAEIFGYVSGNYTLIQPREFCQVWDQRVKKPIETFGALEEGRTLFMTTKLPTIDVKGDEVEMYLAGISPMTGSNAAEARITPVRIVCRNTLIMSARMASERYRIVHDEKALERIGIWLGQLMARAESRVAVMKEAFDILASSRVSAEGWDSLVEAAYPLKEMPDHNAPTEVMETRVKKTEAKNAQILLRRTAAYELFEGSGLGMDHPAAAGTYWGAYNAIAETENYRKSRSLETASEEVLFGRRGAVMERAFDASLRLARAS